ncbi:hypothetical protein LY76DRAFT_593273 [Colletotrichum caudatum]|nr:hypothetical protein LY76DRAFT_593273 [Colletotrichum caudatum]
MIDIDTTASFQPLPSPTGPGSTLFVFALLPLHWFGLLLFLALGYDDRPRTMYNATTRLVVYLMVKTPARFTMRGWQLNSCPPSP